MVHYEGATKDLWGGKGFSLQGKFVLLRYSNHLLR
jgi:hypothetical protein